MSEQEPAAKRTVQNLVNNVFQRTEIQFPQNVNHIYRNEDYAAVLSLPDSPQNLNVIKIAVWHLPSATQKWETTFAHSIVDFKTQQCWLSRTGVFLMQTVFLCSRQKFYVIDNGFVNREFPERSHNSFDVEGDRILRSFTDLFEDSKRARYFNEADPTGKLIYQLELDKSIVSLNKFYTFNHQYWICLLGNLYPEMPSHIEIVNRESRTRTVFEMPPNPENILFREASIVRDQLFFLITSNFRDFEMYQLNLTQQTMTRKFQACVGPNQHMPNEAWLLKSPISLVVTSNYAAWIVFSQRRIGNICYLDINTQTIRQHYIDQLRLSQDAVLSISGSLLTIFYTIKKPKDATEYITFDMATGNAVNMDTTALVNRDVHVSSQGILVSKTYHDDLTAEMTIINYQNP